MTGERGLTAQQVDYLLQPVQHHRVREDDRGHSHLPQQDVRAHLTRVFGFGNWSSEVRDTSLVFEEPGAKSGRWDACYRATVRLTIRDQHGQEVAHYEDTSTGDAQNQTHLAAHDLALKSAVSTALKRAATSLGDQFGLSLYNKGSEEVFVRFTLVHPGSLVPSAAEVPAADEEESRADNDQGAAEDGYSGDAASNSHEADDSPPDLREPPEEVAEREVSQRQAWRKSRNSGRRGPAVDVAKTRLWDAFTEATDAYRTSQAERMDGINAECTRRGWNSIGQLSTEHLDILSDYYEEKADDAIRARYASGNA